MKNERFYPAVLCLIALVAAFVLIVVREGDYLQRVQELNLFLYTPLYFQQQITAAGGLLVWLGTYFTQYFYHPWLGALLLCVWCCLLAWLSWRAFRPGTRWAPVLVALVALVLLTDFDLGYWIYFLKLRGHFFITVIGTSLAVALTWAYRSLPSRWQLRPLFIVIATLLCYPLAGFYALLAAALMVIISWRLTDMRLTDRAIATAAAVVAVAFVPLMYYRYVFSQTAKELIWWQALPNFAVGSETYNDYYWPYGLLFALLALLALTYGRGSGLPTAKKPLRLCLAAHVVAVAAIVVGLWHFWYKDKNFYIELQMNAAIEEQDWQRVLELSLQTDDASRQIVIMRYLAFFKLGQAGNQMYSLRDGDRPAASPLHVPLVESAGKPLYFYYGLPNYCHRWCVEDGVEQGFRTEHIKYMLRCAVVNGEWQAAQRYIDLLSKTRYHGDWARHYEPLLGDSAALARDPEMGPILHLTKYENTLASDKSVLETFLVELLSNRQTNDPVCADLVLMHALQSKDIPTFWRAFFQYANLNTNVHMPRHYQEAAILYGNLERNVDISRMPFDKGIVDSFTQFMQEAQSIQNMTEAQMADMFYPRFGNTFFYNYFLRRGVRTY